MAISSAAPQIPPLEPSSPIFQRTRAALAAIMPADFDKQSYWHKRFASEKAFEWLVKSADFMPLVEPVLERLDPATARILHIGFGTSDLQNHFRARGFRNLLNVDYEPLAIDRGRELETQAFGDVQMRYEVQDATQLDLKEKFDLIVDKSTVDAISCAGETPLRRQNSTMKSILLFLFALTTLNYAQVIGGWTQVDWALEQNNPLFLDNLFYGVDYVVEEGIAEETLNESEWEVLEVNNVETQLVAGTNYDFDVTIIDTAGDTADLDFIVWDQLDGTQEVTSWAISNVQNVP